MKHKSMLCALLGVLCVCSMALGAAALEVECDTTYCFSASDFAAEEELTGICITQLPAASAGTVMLGQRVLRPGDILTAEQVAQMTFHPLRRESDLQAQMTYLPVYRNRVDTVAAMSIAVIGKTDQAPAAEDSAMETYRNLPNEGMLKVKDPEGQPLTFTVIRQPKRGDVVIRDDGSFHYTPKKNKVGVDSFTYTATDPAGNVSREATVTVTITKPADAAQYQDTANESCRFAAEWMKNTGIFVSEAISGNHCFLPDKNVSRSEFLTMLVGLLELQPDTQVSEFDFGKDSPDWLKPYLAAAMRSGLLSGLPELDAFDVEEPITGAEAAVMLQNALDLTAVSDAVDAVSADSETAPDWAAEALQILSDYGFELSAERVLTRGEAAETMYLVSQLAPEAPGTMVFRMTR